MNWSVHTGNILDVPADVLVCSANVFLTLSGGVGGAFLQRYGFSMQDALSQYLAARGVRHANRGDIVEMPSCGSPYRAVLHAVAVDGAYETTPDTITELVRHCLLRSAELSATTVALSALATGYGRKPIDFFGNAIKPLLTTRFDPIETVIIGVRSPSEADELQRLLMPK